MQHFEIVETLRLKTNLLRFPLADWPMRSYIRQILFEKAVILQNELSRVNLIFFETFDAFDAFPNKETGTFVIG